MPHTSTEAGRKYYIANREKILAARKLYVATHPDRVKACMDRWRAEHPGYSTEHVKKWRLENPKRLAEQRKKEKKIAKRRKQTDPEYREKQRLYYLEWNRKAYAAKPEEFRKKARDQYARHCEEYRKNQRAYRHKNLDAHLARNRSRRAKEHAANGTHTSEDITALFQLQAGRCANPYCQVRIRKSGKNKFHVDHKNPISRGGSNWKRNLQLLCAECNIQKRSRTQREWMAWQVRLYGQ